MEPLNIYALIQPLVQKEINDAIDKYASNKKYEIAQIPAHDHDGVSSFRISFEDLLGIPVISSAPTDMPLNGTIRLYNLGADYKLYAFIAGVWKSVTLT